VTLNAALQATAQVIPEAGWLVLLGFGLLALATRSRRSRGVCVVVNSRELDGPVA